MVRVVGLLFAVAVMGAAFAGAPPQAAAQADLDIPACLDSRDERFQAEHAEGMRFWWSQRTPEEKKLIHAVPCEERHIPGVCIFLRDPDLHGCVNRRIAERRAMRACQADGHEILTVELRDCMDARIPELTPSY